jgi:hypothetical protein
MLKIFFLTMMFLAFTLSLAMVNGEHPKTMPGGPDSKAFKILKERSIDPKTGLPKTLDPSLFKGKAKRAYQIAREIPEVLTQMPCFCECEAFGHENLLDCFIDEHGAG